MAAECTKSGLRCSGAGRQRGRAANVLTANATEGFAARTGAAAVDTGADPGAERYYIRHVADGKTCTWNIGKSRAKQRTDENEKAV